MSGIARLAQTWPPAPGSYDYVLTLNDEEIAWEGLRRNPDYRRHYRLNTARHVRSHRLPSDQSVWRIASHPSGCERWGLHPFVDPALIAPEAPIQWLTDPGTATLHAVAKRAPSPTLADLGLADHPCIRQIVIGPDRTECLLIRTSRRSLTLRLTGHRATSAPVCLTFHVPARSMVREAAASLASFPDLLRRTPR